MNKLHIARVPLLGGRLIWDRNRESVAETLAAAVFATNLTAHHRDGDGKLRHIYDLGSGLVTHMGVSLLAQDSQALVSGTVQQALANLKYHGSGTGVTAAAATDYQLGTANGTAATADTTHTRADVTPSATIQTVATLAYGGTLAITEWGLFNGPLLTQATGSPATATTANSLTATATPFGANAFQGFLVRAVTTTVHGLIASNTTSVLTLATNPGWFNDVGGAAGATPSGTTVYTLLPCMFDHKVFAAINVVAGDSIQFTYTLTLTSGG